MPSSARIAENECAHDLLMCGETVKLTAFGGSMRPFIQHGDKLSIRRDCGLPSIGDIVWLSIDGRDVIHRLIDVDPAKGFLTRGDALPTVDGWSSEAHYMGTVLFVERGSISRGTPDSRAHRCLVAFLRGLRHINWTLAKVFRAKR